MTVARRGALLAALATLLLPAASDAAPPVAVLTGPETATTGQGVGFEGSASTDPDRGPLGYAWSIDGQDVRVDQDWLAVSFAYRGPHVVALTVTDREGERDTARHTIEVQGRDRPSALPGLPLPPAVREILTAEPRVGLLAPPVRIHRHRLRVIVRCRGAARCTGVLKARARLRRDGPRLLLGRRAFDVRPGRRTLVAIPVRRAVRARLARHDRLRIRVTAFRSGFPLSGVWDSLRFRLHR